MSGKFSYFLILLLPATSFAQGYQKNDLPCISELCVGDGLPELEKIKWDRAKSDFSITGEPDYVGSRPLPGSAVNLVKQVYRGDLTKSAPYLSSQTFDGGALTLLTKVVAACSTQELRGTFTSPNGNPTTVKIALLSDSKDPATQRWTVISISRNFPSAITDAQKIDIRKQLDERYGRFSVSRGRQHGINAIYSVHDDPLQKGRFGFNLSLKIPVNELEQERKHPACGGQRKVSID